MLKRERRMADFLMSHLLIVAVLFASFISIYARYRFFPHISKDMLDSLIKWFNRIKAAGGVKALRNRVGDYGIQYQTVIALLTYIPVDPAVQYKLLSCAFDYLLAWGLSRLIYELSGKRLLQAMVYIAAIALPTVMLNSAAWGQCDSIYSFFCVLTLLMLAREKYIACFLAYGMAFSFKLQAIFLLPMLLFMWIYRRRYSILHFLLVPATYILTCLPAIIAGRPIRSIFYAYLKQVGEYPRIAMNYPSFWLLMQNNSEKAFYDTTHMMAIVFTVMVLLCIMVLLLRRCSRLDTKDFPGLAFIFAYTCVIFLPSMHERYGYLYVVLGIAVIALERRMWPAFIAIVMIDLHIYGTYLFGVKDINWQLLAFLNLCCYAYCVWVIVAPLLARRIRSAENNA